MKATVILKNLSIKRKKEKNLFKHLEFACFNNFDGKENEKSF